MDARIFQQKDIFPRFVKDKLSRVELDYREKNLQIEKSRQDGSKHLKAGVVLLLHYKKIRDQSEYVFQLIKRSDKVSQGGDISCPGGMLQPRHDTAISCLLKTGILPLLRDKTQRRMQSDDKETNSLIRLYLTTALREAWEEIGLNPLKVTYMGALPSYSLSLLARTIFPVVCLTSKPFTYRLSPEVEKILEIPLNLFFQSDNYATLNIRTFPAAGTAHPEYQMPCFVIPDGCGNDDILWGATFNIIRNFLNIVSDGGLPVSRSDRIFDKVLTVNYISPKG